jgi:hypothetical protein
LGRRRRLPASEDGGGEGRWWWGPPARSSSMGGMSGVKRGGDGIGTGPVRRVVFFASLSLEPSSRSSSAVVYSDFDTVMYVLCYAFSRKVK